jgi:hypothetical protein
MSSMRMSVSLRRDLVHRAVGAVAPAAQSEHPALLHRGDLCRVNEVGRKGGERRRFGWFEERDVGARSEAGKVWVRVACGVACRVRGINYGISPRRATPPAS